MNIRHFLALTIVIILSCNTTRPIILTEKKDLIEIVEYKNFKSDRIENYAGIAIIRKHFQDNKLISVKFFDLNDEPIRNEKSWDKKNAEWRFEYDEKGNFIKQMAYNYLGEICLVENWGNSAIEIFKYDGNNQLIENSNYNKSMELVGLGDIGNAVTQYGYNENRQLIWMKSFNSKREFISNGYCYSKFKYNSDGTLKKHIYLYDENKINTYSTYTYDEEKLIREETFNEANERIGYEFYDYDEKGRIVRKEDWYYKWEKPNVNKRQISLELDGWIIQESDIAKIVFEEFGKGEYSILINSEGEIQNIEPIEHKGGRVEFAMEVYSKFRNISLKRNVKSDNMNLKGKLTINIPFQKIGRFYDMEKVLNPNPDNNY